MPSYRNQSIDLHSKSIDWFLYEGNTGTLCVKYFSQQLQSSDTYTSFHSPSSLDCRASNLFLLSSWVRTLSNSTSSDWVNLHAFIGYAAIAVTFMLLALCWVSFYCSVRSFLLYLFFFWLLPLFCCTLLSFLS